MASSTHTSLPKPFASGNVREWLTRFDICSDANGWDEKVRAVRPVARGVQTGAIAPPHWMQGPLGRL